jgi:hypothetical protein
MEMYVGLDVHSKSSVFVTQDADGKLVGRGEVPASREGLEQLCSQFVCHPERRWPWRRERWRSS